MLTVVLFVVAALIVGYSKTAVGGLAVISVVIFASLLPTKESTGALLLVLIVGDLVAVWHYRRDADWSLIRELLPLVVPGLLLGAAFLAVVDDRVLRRSIGVLLLVLCLLQLLLQVRTRRATTATSTPSTATTAAAAARAESADRTILHSPTVETRRRRGPALLAGLGAGFATMTANAAGAVMTLFLVARGVEKRRFVGTGAWFFLGVNLIKVPFSLGLGLIHLADLWRAIALGPAVVVGGWVGLHTIRRISQARFEQVVLLASALAATALIVR